MGQLQDTWNYIYDFYLIKAINYYRMKKMILSIRVGEHFILSEISDNLNLDFGRQL